jgi:hypothetical protein
MSKISRMAYDQSFSLANMAHYECSSLLLPTERDCDGRPSLSQSNRNLIRMLEAEGFSVNVFDSHFRSTGFVIALLSLDGASFKTFATELGLPVLANTQSLKNILHGGKGESLSMASPEGQIYLDERVEAMEATYLPYDFRLDADFNMYNKSGVPGGVGALVESTRQVVIDNILENKLGMSRLVESGVVLACFPQHSEKKQLKLWYYYTSRLTWCMSPLTQIHKSPQCVCLRDYAGKASALAVAFGQVFAFAHLPLAAPGLCVSLFESADSSSLSMTRSMLALLMPLLGLLAVRLWERRESQIAAEWGSHSPTALALSLPLTHSPFIRASCSVDSGDQYELVPASTLPLKAAGRSWWSDTIRHHAAGHMLTGGQLDVTEELLWPLKLKHPVLLHNSLQHTLVVLATTVTTLVLTAAILGAQLAMSLCIRAMVAYPTRSMAGGDSCMFILPLLVHAVAATASWSVLTKVCIALTHRENWRTCRQHYHSQLWKEVLVKLILWFGPTLWALLQSPVEGQCKFYDGSCPAAAGATVTWTVLLLCLSDTLLQFALPAMKVRARADALKVTRLTNQTLRDTAHLLRQDSNGNSSSRDACSPLSWPRLLNPHSSSVVEEGLAVCPPLHPSIADATAADESSIPRPMSFSMSSTTTSSKDDDFSRDDDGSTASARAAENAFLVLDRPARPDRDLDDYSRDSNHHDLLVSTTVRYALVWSLFGLAPWTMAVTTLQSCMEVFMVAYHTIFHRRRSLEPATQLLGLNTAALSGLRFTAVLASILAAAIVFFARESDSSAGALPLALESTTGLTSSSLFFLYCWIVLLAVTIIDTTLPRLPDSVIFTSLRNEHVWRELQSKLYPDGYSPLKVETAAAAAVRGAGGKMMHMTSSAGSTAAPPKPDIFDGSSLTTPVSISQSVAGSSSVVAPQSVAAPSMYEELTGESSDSDEYVDDAIDDRDEGSDEDEGEDGVVFTDTPISSRVTNSIP